MMCEGGIVCETGKAAMLAQFRDEHEELRVAMYSFARLLSPRFQPTVMDELVAARLRFAQLFLRHVAAEDSYVQQSLIRVRRHDGAALARSYPQDMRALQSRYSAHIRHWTPALISQDWGAYRDAVLDLQRQLTARMLWEEQEAFTLLPA